MLPVTAPGMKGYIMRASILDLRRHMRDILKALDRNESITLTYRGQKKATIIPAHGKKKANMQEHEAFGIWCNRHDLDNVNSTLRRLRKGRVNAF